MVDTALLKIINPNDKVAIISPSGSLKKESIIKKLAEERMNEEFALKIIYGRNSLNNDEFNPLSVRLRIEDLHEAFLDNTVKAIICSTGGSNSNELLSQIDWNIIKDNPKPFIGSSDITVLLNAIYAKTGINTYHGPNFYKFGMKLNLEYTIEYFKKCLMAQGPFSIYPCKKWSDDKWYKNQEERTFYKNEEKFLICNRGKAKGHIIGGNLCSLNLLQGTEYMPSLVNSILFIEDDDLAGDETYGEFNRNLQSLLLLPEAKYINGIVVGRFSQNSFMSTDKILHIFSSKKELSSIPIIANVNFGHCEPNITFPIGGYATLFADKDSSKIEIINH